MKLGMHASAWKDWRDDNATAAIRETKRLGLDFVEIPLTSHEGLRAVAIANNLKEAGLQAVTSALITNQSFDITSEFSENRAAGIDFLKKCVRLTSEIGADFFGGVLYGPHMKLSTGRPSEELMHRAASGLREVAHYAKELGITLGLEPINRYETCLVNTCEQALKLIRLIGEPNVKVHLDTYHMNIEEKNVSGAIRQAGSLLGHIHLNESDWGIPGTAHTDWQGIFGALQEINYAGYASLECVIELDGGYVWRQLAPDNRTLAEEGIRFLKGMRDQYFRS
ncbi:sugar phosphate isomerase/epimerase family protein [Cohnella faecalis]|uniref:Sugar phosphate isomerase/epimerase n=1 Tax=Cohnella faecalis TaxID=2315694 RepID=A0A398CPN7_9BACL|nr:sugar phosphate isomerase/epimerase family protein [Cohnella faecalis]RIE00924.1 sugar phosphate isomerase/epimerase [Cohnella faecalis]